MTNRRRDGPRFAHFTFWICHFGFVIVSPVLISLFLPATGYGEASISYPLEGHYRAGHYMPVRVTTHDQPGAITLSAHGAMPTEIRPAADFDGIVPWLAVGDSLREPNWTSSSAEQHPLILPFKALDDDERLVAFAGGDSDIAKQLFPGKTIVPVALDLSRPLLEPAEAWESLDAVVLSEAAAARLNERHRATLLCGGTILAIQSNRRPDAQWPWQQVGDYWVLRWNVAGPNSAQSPEAYTPTYNWERGWSAVFRRTVMLFGVVFALLATGIVLWPSRWAVAAFVSVSVLLAGGFAYWYSRQSPVPKLEAGVSVRSGTLEQRDTWSWQSPLRSTKAAYRCADFTHPIFATLAQVQSSAAKLICGPDGSPQQITFAIAPGQSLAFLDRTLGIGFVNEQLQAADPQFVPFVDRLYVRAGEQIAGQFWEREPGFGHAIPVIVVRASK